MPKKSKHPRLRTHIRKGAAGQVWVSYWYDMRQEGLPDVSLGTDYDEAIKQWHEIHEHKPRIAGTIMEAMTRWESEALSGYSNPETCKSYARQLKRIAPVFGPATWDSVKLHHLTQYLEDRSAKTQANREMAVFQIVWNFARKKGLTELPWPAAGMEKSRWRNQEPPRQIDVTDALFAAIYEQANGTLRDVMDLASATGF